MSRSVRITALVMAVCASVAYADGALRTGDRDEIVAAEKFNFADGGSSAYFTFPVGSVAGATRTLVFLFGGSGCRSWKSVLPQYLDGFAANARVFALNKRFVPSNPSSEADCGPQFHQANQPTQWIADYREFISAMLRMARSRPRNVVLVGPSEGAWVAARVSSLTPEVTHLVVIGDGGLSMRESLKRLVQRGYLPVDLEAELGQIASDPRSIDKKKWGNTYRWWSDVLDLDPLPDYLAITIPIFVGVGASDTSVPAESAIFLTQKFNEAGKTNLRLRVYPGADHRLFADGVSNRRALFAEVVRELH